MWIAIRRAYEILGPEPQLFTKPEHKNNETKTSVYVDTTYVLGNADDYKYSIGTLHRDPEDMGYYKVKDVVKDTLDESGPLKGTDRLHATKTGMMQPMPVDDHCRIHTRTRSPRSPLLWSPINS